MKKLLSLFSLLIVLTGCSSGNHADESKPAENNTAKAEQPARTAETAVPQVKEDVYVPNPQITDDRKLLKVGETVSDEKGKITLKAYKKVDETVNVGPIEMKVTDIKVMHFVPAYSMIDFYHAYTHDEEFDLIKIGVELKNTSKEKIKYTPIAAIKMNSGEHKTWEDDTYLEELIGEIEPGDVKKGNMGFILSKTPEAQSVEVLTSDAVDLDHNVLEQGKHLNIEF